MYVSTAQRHRFISTILGLHLYMKKGLSSLCHKTLNVMSLRCTLIVCCSVSSVSNTFTSCVSKASMANSSANRSIRCFTISSYCAMHKYYTFVFRKMSNASPMRVSPFVWHPFCANDKVNVGTADNGDFGTLHRCFRSFFNGHFIDYT